ncbi:hypothetical protein [Noviherbaspirillum malthae]|uniref:hypothetical protein n=1 Tax=Noviherbaspirillum malthae TaxID=1260987 RepID=UPI0018906E02|nr:hypothetical protein [Noviherbaspirillum malthae]
MSKKRYRIAPPTFVALDYFEAAAEWYDWARDRELNATMLSLAADAIALQADQGDGAIVRHHWLTKAVEAYQRVAARFYAQLDVNTKSTRYWPGAERLVTRRSSK